MMWSQDATLALVYMEVPGCHPEAWKRGSEAIPLEQGQRAGRSEAIPLEWGGQEGASVPL